jgi:hypothetical protein
LPLNLQTAAPRSPAVPLEEALRRVGRALHADVEVEPDGAVALQLALARRQAGKVLQTLRYRVRLEGDPASRTVFFQETLWEDDGRPALDLAARLAEKEQAYRVTGAEGRGNLEGVAALFGQRYGVTFDFPQIRLRLRDACEAEGFTLRHLVPL